MLSFEALRTFGFAPAGSTLAGSGGGNKVFCHLAGGELECNVHILQTEVFVIFTNPNYVYMITMLYSPHGVKIDFRCCV